MSSGAGYYLYSYTDKVMSYGYSNDDGVHVVLGSLTHYFYTGQSYSGFVTSVEPDGENGGVLHSQGQLDGEPCTCKTTIKGNSVTIEISPGPLSVTATALPKSVSAVTYGSNWIWK